MMRFRDVTRYLRSEQSRGTVMPVFMFGVFTLIGVLLLYRGGVVPVVRSWFQSEWIETPCEILTVGLEHSVEGVRPQVSFRYAYRGRSYAGASYDRFGRWHATEAGARSMLLGYKPGPRLCYVNPAAPSEAVLSQFVPQWQWTAWVILGAVFLFLGLSVQTLMVTRLLSDMREVNRLRQRQEAAGMLPAEPEEASRKRGPWLRGVRLPFAGGCSMMKVAFLSALTVVTVSYTSGQYRLQDVAAASAQWPQARAQLDHCDIERTEHRRWNQEEQEWDKNRPLEVRFLVTVFYHYEVEGRLYPGRMFSLGSGAAERFANRADAEALRDRLRTRDPLLASYNPQSPDVAVLFPGTTDITWTRVIVAGIFSVFAAVLLLVALVQRWRGVPRELSQAAEQTQTGAREGRGLRTRIADYFRRQRSDLPLLVVMVVTVGGFLAYKFASVESLSPVDVNALVPPGVMLTVLGPDPGGTALGVSAVVVLLVFVFTVLRWSALARGRVELKRAAEAVAPKANDEDGS
ncbi:MAG: DUF3592 domain-containing protein [Planctomycetota bacterium]|jgi:hypothetical protein|nr:DUF3592 domain-containing protein [Planctomycetota bacterium]